MGALKDLRYEKEEMLLGWRKSEREIESWKPNIFIHIKLIIGMKF